jgi:hypothetical protein
MTFRICVLLLLTVFFNSPAQVRELLIGKWDYHTIRNIDEAEPISRSLLKIVVGDNSFYQFTKDQKYIAFENNSFHNGDWRLEQNNTKLVLVSELGNTYTFEIISLTKHTLVLLIKGEAYHTLVRSHGLFKGNQSSVSSIPGEVQASIEELSKKWVLTQLMDSLETSEINIQMTEFVKGGWFEFNGNGSYAKKMITHEKNGVWKFQNDNRTIIMIDEDGFGSVWNICFISGAKLILQRPGTSIQHIFTALY